jgi:hypothetical protein
VCIAWVNNITHAGSTLGCVAKQTYVLPTIFLANVTSTGTSGGMYVKSASVAAEEKSNLPT